MQKFRTLLAASLALTLTSAVAIADTVNGEIKKINPDTQKITIKHGPIKKLDMDAMTMVFKAADPKMLGAVKVGDKVTFEADRVNGQITVTKIEKK